MWCKTCQQDVPCLPADNFGQFHCPRCGEIAVDRMTLDSRGAWAALDRPMTHYTVSPAEATPPSPWLPSSSLPSTSLPCSAEPLPAIQDWAVEAALDRIGKMLAGASPPPDEPTVTRLDPPHVLAEKPAPKPSGASRIGMSPPGRDVSNGATSAGGSILAWVAMMFGTTAGACGAVLLLWSTIRLRPELWQLGMPIAMVGAGLLLTGVFLQLDHLRMQGRSPARRTAPRRSAASDRSKRSGYRRMSS